MNHCGIHQIDYEVACPECMGEMAMECSTIVYGPSLIEEWFRKYSIAFLPAPRPEHAPWLKGLPKFNKVVIYSSRNYGRSWSYEFCRKAEVLADYHRGLSRSDLWAKYPEFTKAQIRKLLRGIGRGRTRAEAWRLWMFWRKPKPVIAFDEEAV